MCGIAGLISFEGDIEPKYIESMNKILRHRGPDDEGFLGFDTKSLRVYELVGDESKILGTHIRNFKTPVNGFLGHRRLSIIDLSTDGHQPFHNDDKTLWIVFNGEVYN